MVPFNNFKTPELSLEEEEAYFVKPKNVDKLYNTNTCFIFGERGSGKTTVLKYLERYFEQNKNSPKIAVYYRFETAYMNSLYNQRLDDEDNILNFSQSICAILCKLICQKLIKINEADKMEREEEICRDLYETMIMEEDECTFESLQKTFERIRKETLFNIRNQEKKIFFDFYTVLEIFADSIRKEKGYEKLQICILLDEYENLTLFQQKVINSMVKASTEKVNYRICLRPEGFWTKDTLAKTEFLNDPDDYISFDYVEDIMGDESDIQVMMREICRNRLAYSYESENIKYQKEDLIIDNYLAEQDRMEELEQVENLDEYYARLKEKISEKCKQNMKEKLDCFDDIIDLQMIDILLEKKYEFDIIYKEFLKKTKKYINWRHNYETNAFYIILQECGANKTYCGMNIMLKLANYNVRLVLDILRKCFKNYDFHDGCKNQVSVYVQDKVIKEVSRNKFSQIEYIPYYGYELKNLTNAVGKYFRKCILDERAQKFEANNFVILVSNNLGVDDSKKIKDVLKYAVIWGIFIQDKANKDKNRHRQYTYDDTLYILHPIYSVYFNISYRRKQKVDINDDVILKMFMPMSDIEASNLISKKGKMKSKKDKMLGQMILPIDNKSD